MLLRVYIHTGQAWKICLATVGFEPTNPTVARNIFQACPVWIYTQSNITQASYSPEYITPTQQISFFKRSKFPINLFHWIYWPMTQNSTMVYIYNITSLCISIRKCIYNNMLYKKGTFHHKNGTFGPLKYFRWHVPPVPSPRFLNNFRKL
jgi:hypothetical protein